MKILIILMLLSLGDNILHSEALTRQCVTNAERNEKGECVCISGYHGRGDLCCMPTDHKICMIMGDPLIETMNGDVLPLDVPCPTEISEVHTWGDKYDETVHAFMAGGYGKDGILEMDYLRLEYEEIYNDIHTLIEIYNSTLKINGEIIDSKEWDSKEYMVSMRYNESIDTYSMRSMGTTIIHFIPQAGQPTNRSVPGVCVAVALNSLLEDQGMCNQRARGLQRNKYNNGFKTLHPGVIEHIIRVEPHFNEIGPIVVQEKCEAINKMRVPCGDKWNPAMAACYAIASHSDIRYCLDKSGLDVLTVFQECTKAHCGLKSSSCTLIKSQAVKKCIDVQPDCSGFY